MSINLVILGGFPYPKGMAVTRHVQLVIDGFRAFPDISMKVLILRQSSKDNPPFGMHRGIHFETVMPDALRIRSCLAIPVLFLKARKAINRAYCPGKKNILYVYGPPSFDNVPVIRWARRLGFIVVFEITEDDDLAMGILDNWAGRILNIYIRRATAGIRRLADGIVVVSSHLKAKFERVTSNKAMVYYRPVPVDVSAFPDSRHVFGDTISLFYSGSFGLKDGVCVLLDAFDQLAGRHRNLRLVMTGKGSDKDMRVVVNRVARSPHIELIEYKGYLDDEVYLTCLQAADIPCMTRIDHPYANAGFPFKLAEFLATGKPVVASMVSDVQMWLEDGRSAMLVKPGDPSQIVQKVEYLLSNPKLAGEIGQAGRQIARRYFSHQVQARGLYDFIKGLGPSGYA